MESAHRFRLGDTAWFVWRDSVLRTTGFPASGLDWLAAPECATTAGAHLAGTVDLARFREMYDETVTACAAVVNEIAADKRLREAITWQSPSAITLLDSLLTSGPPTPRTKRRRYRERQFVRFWQRYCAKAETIGFFGPVTWSTIDSNVRSLKVAAGPDLVRRRAVFFEPWALVTYGALLARDPDIRMWLPPAPIPDYVLDGHLLRRPGLPSVSLSPGEHTALLLSDGRRPGAHIVSALTADARLDVSSFEEGYAILESLVRRRLLRWDANLPLTPAVADLLDERIAAISDPRLRERATTGLARLRAAKSAVADAAGEPGALGVALAALDDEFVAVTGHEPRRRHGQTYAGRSLCYEDTTRDLDLTLGTAFLDEIGPALSIMLTAARWLTSELAAMYEARLRGLYIGAKNRRRDAQGADSVMLGDIWVDALPLFLEEGRQRTAEVLDNLRARLHSLFDLPAHTGTSRVELTSAELAGRVEQLFRCVGPGWSFAQVHSPDLDICARSPEAINEGDYLVVLGELHVAYATLGVRCLTWPLDDPDDVLRRAVADYGQPRIVPLLPSAWPGNAGRAVYVEPSGQDWQLGFGKAPVTEASRLVPVDSVPLFVSDSQIVGRLPDGSVRPLLEFFAYFLSMISVNALRSLATDGHTPRVTIDRLVAFRETWRLTFADVLDLATLSDGWQQYLAARRLVARLGTPDRCFVSISTERKPFFVDFTSPLSVSMLCSTLRAVDRSDHARTRLILSEMLPTPEQAWVPDAVGNRYFGELRLHLTDGMAITNKRN